MGIDKNNDLCYTKRNGGKERRMDTVYLYDIFHVRHVLCVGGFDIGETVINTDNRNPVIQYGSAPIDLLPYWGHWFTLAQAEHDLVSIGFKKIDKTMWIRGGL